MKVKQIFWLTLFLNLLVSGAKLVFATMTQSLSLFSDGLHSLVDASSNIVALVALRVAQLPPDEDHPYGHRKFETLGAMGISALLCFAAWEILSRAFHRILHPGQSIHVELWVVAGLAGTVVVNLTVTAYERKWGHRLQSPLLLADAEHTRSDALASLLALLALGAAAFHYYWVDAFAAIFIVALILWAAYRIIKDSVLTLSDAQRLNPMPIQELAERVKGVQNCHMVRSHGAVGDVHVDLHIVVEPTMSAEEAFEIENEVTRRLKEVYPEISEVTIRHQPRMPASAQKRSP